jgi:hypothetical protein
MPAKADIQCFFDTLKHQPPGHRRGGEPPVPGLKTSEISFTGVNAHWILTVKWEIQFFSASLLDFEIVKFQKSA